MARPTGRPAGRPRGAKSYKAASLKLLLGRMESEGTLTPRKVLERLQEIALSDAPDRVAASRLLCGYLFGYPTSRLDLTQTHELGPSAVELLIRIHESDEHRHHLEVIENRRRLLNAVTVEIDAVASPTVDSIGE